MSSGTFTIPDGVSSDREANNGFFPIESSTVGSLIDEDDDDMEYVPPSEEEEDEDEDESDEDDTAEFVDAQDSFGDVEIEGSVGENGGIILDGLDDTDTARTSEAVQNDGRPVYMTPTQLLRALQSDASFRRLFTRGMARRRQTGLAHGDDDDTDQNETYSHRRRNMPTCAGRQSHPKKLVDKFPKVPSARGQELMKSGHYGVRDHFSDIMRKRNKNLGERLMWRRLGAHSRGSFQQANGLISQSIVPSSSTADRIIHYDSRAYSGQFSDDGNFFFSCTQDFKVRMYDTSNPYDWKYYKTVDYPWGQWTITDASLSPQNRWLAYSSIRHIVCLASTDPSDTSEPRSLNFANFSSSSTAGRRNRAALRSPSWFGIWTLRFSGDGREIVAGTSDHSVIVYDLERQKSTLKLENHRDDVNAVCFGDASSPHILYSGSDDQTIRVWDRRSMADGHEAGIFVGHTEGLTYVDSKGDGRYVLSNGKDQTMKLWDLRKMVSPSAFEGIDMAAWSTNFDYRVSPFDFDDYEPNPHDCSVVTFRGHSVLKTLIRCHFSPPSSTNSAYVYSGSADGSVWIWNLDGTVKEKINVEAATKGTRPMHPDSSNYTFLPSRHASKWQTCVRDASWHPHAPLLGATSWNGWGMHNGTVSVHSWNDGADEDEGDPPLSTNYNERLEIAGSFNQHSRQRRSDRNTTEAATATASGRRVLSRAVLPAASTPEDEEGDDEVLDGW